jgi:hypothetical protein
LSGAFHVKEAVHVFELVQMRHEFVVGEVTKIADTHIVERRSKRAHCTNDDRQRAFAPQ